MTAAKTSKTLSMNHKNDRIIEMKRNMHRLEQYSRRECIEIAGVPKSMTVRPSRRTRHSDFQEARSGN